VDERGEGGVEGLRRAHDLGGYYRPDDDQADAVMRPSQTLNDILATLG